MPLKLPLTQANIPHQKENAAKAAFFKCVYLVSDFYFIFVQNFSCWYQRMF
jgi:hypothetical protein